ncbi:flagellar hook-length control protein-like protein [Candidatus Kuenenia stuttgartiensis]|uniref:Flagellar hook-length control protein-like protein n=1 Tax=Kuenenia stuttgartiensis TaxID=174633 RepID=A0A6G7GUS2_KUEST|nr:flagellar hook-length control protein FliK [Candidatus Kuenenia stuttgartiensis]QII13338.1 flagellar hook-length control protein-like protein [Candidatus Kuenenia stuttgartiensis]
MSAILELFNSSYSSPKMLNEARQDANNANISANGSNTGLADDEVEDLAEGETLPFEELLTQHTSPSAKKQEGKSAKNTVETLSKTTTEKIAEGEEPEGDTIFANILNPDDLANTIINVLQGNANTAESEKLYNFFNTITSENALFSDTDKGEILAALKQLLNSLKSPPYPPQREGIKLLDTLTSFFQTNPSKDDGVSLQSGVFAERLLPAFTGEGISLHPNILADKEGNTKNTLLNGDSGVVELLPQNKSFDTRSTLLESFIFNANTKGMASSGNSSITNMPPAASEGIVSQLNGLLNNYEGNVTVSEISLTDSKTREAHNALKSLLQTMVNVGMDNASSFNTPMDAVRTDKMPVPPVNNVFSFNAPTDAGISMQEFSELTMNRASKTAEIQKVFLQNNTGEINGFAHKITNDPNNSAGKNEAKDAGTKEQTASSANTSSGSGSFLGNEEGNSSGNLSQQGKDTFAFAPNNNQQEKTPVNNAQLNNLDFRQNISEPLSGSATTILSSAENQKNVASPLFQGNTPPGTNTLQNNVMEQLLENIKTLRNGNTSEIKLQLTPPALGTVRLHFTEENDEVRAKIYVENAEVKAAIQNNIHRLKESIATNGVEIHRVEVYVQNESKNNHERQSQAYFAEGDSPRRDGARDGSHKEENHTGENENNHKVLSIKNKIAASSNLTIDYIF